MWPCVYLVTLSAASHVLCAQNLIRVLVLLLTIAFISDFKFNVLVVLFHPLKFHLRSVCVFFYICTC